MKWNASTIAALLLLAGCGGTGGFSDHGIEATAPPQGSAPQPRLEATLAEPARPALAYSRPGASYPPPGGAAQGGFADPTAGATGPSGTSRRGAGEARYDEVGYAAVASDGRSAVVATHPTLPSDTIVEVTSLATGRTILALVAGGALPGAGNLAGLSQGAARQLGHVGVQQPIPVRIRKVSATPPDVAALHAGRPAAPRPDTPPVLLNALRRHLPAAVPAAATAAPAPQRPSQTAARPVPTAAKRRYLVQIAALSNARNAQALAKAMGGFVKQGGGLHRVQLGPFATRQEAEQARAGAARAGYGDARVLVVN